MRAAILALIVLASPAWAADGALVKGGPPGTNIEMPFLVAPVIGTDGTLAGYTYLSPRLTATSATAALEVRDRLALIQDAFVRDVNAAAVTAPGDPERVDIPMVQARLLADARRVMGAAKVAAIAICTTQFASLYPEPGQSPAVPAALTSAPKNLPKSRCAP